MLKIRRPLGRLIFNMGIAIPGKTVFLIETAPWILASFWWPPALPSVSAYLNNMRPHSVDEWYKIQMHIYVSKTSLKEAKLIQPYCQRIHAAVRIVWHASLRYNHIITFDLWTKLEEQTKIHNTLVILFFYPFGVCPLIMVERVISISKSSP